MSGASRGAACGRASRCRAAVAELRRGEHKSPIRVSSKVTAVCDCKLPRRPESARDRSLLRTKTSFLNHKTLCHDETWPATRPPSDLIQTPFIYPDYAADHFRNASLLPRRRLLVVELQLIASRAPPPSHRAGRCEPMPTRYSRARYGDGGRHLRSLYPSILETGCSCLVRQRRA